MLWISCVLVEEKWQLQKFVQGTWEVQGHPLRTAAVFLHFSNIRMMAEEDSCRHSLTARLKRSSKLTSNIFVKYFLQLLIKI